MIVGVCVSLSVSVCVFKTIREKSARILNNANKGQSTAEKKENVEEALLPRSLPFVPVRGAERLEQASTALA